MNILAFIANIQGFTVITLALTGIASHVDISQEVHLNLNHAVTLARFATTTFDVKREASRAIAACARFRHARKKLADWGENPSVSGRVRARCTADRALVNKIGRAHV